MAIAWRAASVRAKTVVSVDVIMTSLVTHILPHRATVGRITIMDWEHQATRKIDPRGSLGHSYCGPDLCLVLSITDQFQQLLGRADPRSFTAE